MAPSIGIVQTLRDPRLYTPEQIRTAMTLAYALGQPKFILLEEPKDKP